MKRPVKFVLLSLVMVFPHAYASELTEVGKAQSDRVVDPIAQRFQELKKARHAEDIAKSAKLVVADAIRTLVANPLSDEKAETERLHKVIEPLHMLPTGDLVRLKPILLEAKTAVPATIQKEISRLLLKIQAAEGNLLPESPKPKPVPYSLQEIEKAQKSIDRIKTQYPSCPTDDSLTKTIGKTRKHLEEVSAEIPSLRKVLDERQAKLTANEHASKKWEAIIVPGDTQPLFEKFVTGLKRVFKLKVSDGEIQPPQDMFDHAYREIARNILAYNTYEEWKSALGSSEFSLSRQFLRRTLQIWNDSLSVKEGHGRYRYFYIKIDDSPELAALLSISQKVEHNGGFKIFNAAIRGVLPRNMAQGALDSATSIVNSAKNALANLESCRKTTAEATQLFNVQAHSPQDIEKLGRHVESLSQESGSASSYLDNLGNHNSQHHFYREKLKAD
ncbi:MAG: hypothetical protein HY537_05760 [Deltaproteobacteria bacterium]|nr:hypothetical protein [Deltaproteobacteria bacterium]